MLVAFITNSYAMLLSGDGIMKYLDYPGFEVWKFVNLLIFVGILVYLVRPALSKAFNDKRGDIRAQLQKAQAERDAAVAKLQEVEQRLTKLDDEMAVIRDNAEREAVAEAARMKDATEAEVGKLRVQAQREIENSAKLAKMELRRFTAEQSVKMAEDLLRRELGVADDARLIKTQVASLGGGK